MSVEPLINRYRADLFACRITARADKFGAEIKERDDGKIDVWPVTLENEQEMIEFAEFLKKAAAALQRIKIERANKLIV